MHSLIDYRRSEDAARDVAETLIRDDRIRRECLTLLADAIIQAHRAGSSPAVWAVTLGSTGFIRLNVGAIEVYALLEDTVHVVLDASALADDERERLLEEGGVCAGWLPSAPRVPSAEMWNIPAGHLDTILPLFKRSFECLIEQAAESVRWRTGYYIYHSPGVLAYLRRYLNRDLPDPQYTLKVTKRRSGRS